MTAVFVSAFLFFVFFSAVGYRLTRPLGWRLFRYAHRNNPEALAFADRMLTSEHERDTYEDALTELINSGASMRDVIKFRRNANPCLTGMLPDEFYGPVCIDCGHPQPTRYDHHKTCKCTTCDVPN
jgi:hypothetical protein